MRSRECNKSNTHPWNRYEYQCNDILKLSSCKFLGMCFIFRHCSYILSLTLSSLLPTPLSSLLPPPRDYPFSLNLPSSLFSLLSSLTLCLSQCEQRLDLPAIHFYCQHSYHRHCMSNEGDFECPKCTGEHRHVMDIKHALNAKASYWSTHATLV